MQSYDIISIVVSLSYGKCANMTEIKIAENQYIMKNRIEYPMENCWWRNNEWLTTIYASSVILNQQMF
jgi:hypothetical protein